MEVDDPPQEDVGKTRDHGEEGGEGDGGDGGETVQSGADLDEHDARSDGEASSGEEGELSDEDSPQHMAPASPVAVTPVKHDPIAGDRVKAHHDSMSGSEDNLINCSTSPVDKQRLAKNSSEDNDASEDIYRNVDENALGDNANRDECTEPAVNNVDGLNGDDGDEKQRLLKTSLHDETVELDYEEDGMEDNESLANTGGEDSKELELGELDEKEEGEHTDDSGEISDDKDEGEIVEDDDCEEGEIKDTSGRPPQFTRYVCRFYLRGHCTWGPNCRFVHPGVNDKGNYSMMDQPFIQGPPGRGAPRGPMQRRLQGPWIEEPAEPDLPPPSEEPPTETAWERGLRQAKELRMKASKRKEMEPDFEEKRMHLPLAEDKDQNKENEERTQVVNFEPFELDEYYDKEVHAGWHQGQYENFEVRWNREPADYQMPMPYNRGPEKERLIMEKRHPREMMRYSPVRRNDRRKERPDKHERIRRGDKPGQHSAPVKARVDEWQDPWQRTKSPKRKRSASRSRSRGRPRARRSNSRGSFSSSYSSSSFSSRSSSSYSSYSSRSSASRSSSYSSRSSSRSKSRSPRRHNWKQSGTVPKGGAASRTGDAAPRSTVSRLGHQGAAAGTLGAAIAAERKKAAQSPHEGMRGQPSGATRGQSSAGMRGQPPGRRGQPSGGMRGPSSDGMRGPSSDGMRGPSSDGMRRPSSEGMRGPSSDGMRGPSSGGMRAQPPGRRGQPSAGIRGSSSDGTRGQPSTGTRGQPSTGTRGQPSAGNRAPPSSGNRSQDSAGTRAQPTGSTKTQPSAGSRVPPSSNRLQQPPTGTRTQPSGGTKPQPPSRTQPPANAPSRVQPPSVAALKASPAKVPSPLPSAAQADRSRKSRRHSDMSPRERGRRGGSSSDSSHSSSLSRSSSASSISSSASSGSADSEHLYRDIGSPAGSKQTVSPRKKGDKSRRDASGEKKEPKGKPKDADKKPDPAPSGNNATGKTELYNSETKPAAPGKSVLPSKGPTRISNKQPAKLQTSVDKQATKTAAAAAVKMQVKSTSALKQPARMPERSDAKNKVTPAPSKQEEKGAGSRSADDKASSSMKPRPAPALQAAASVPAAMSVQPAKTKDLLKVAGQKSSIKLTLISKAEKSTSRKRPAPESDVTPSAPPVKRPAKPQVHGAPKQTAPRHAEKAAAKPNSPKAKTTTQQRQAAAPTTKNTANASGAASAPKKSMSSRREELLKQLKAVEDAIARKRAKMT